MILDPFHFSLGLLPSTSRYAVQLQRLNVDLGAERDHAVRVDLAVRVVVMLLDVCWSVIADDTE